MTKAFLIFFGLTLVTAARADGVTSGKTPSDAPTPRSSLNVIEFFEPLDSSSHRHPERLNLTPVTSISQKDFEKKIQGIWALVFHCNGAPVARSLLTSHGLLDGKTGGKKEVQFDEHTEQDFTIVDENPRKSFDGNFEIDSLGKGEFFQFALDDNKGEIRNQKLRIMKIDGAGKDVIGIEVQNLFNPAPSCEDGSRLKTLLLPFENPGS